MERVRTTRGQACHYLKGINATFIGGDLVQTTWGEPSEASKKFVPARQSFYVINRKPWAYSLGHDQRGFRLLLTSGKTFLRRLWGGEDPSFQTLGETRGVRGTGFGTADF